MSELPNSWVTTSIGVVAEVFAGRTPSRFEARLEASQRGGRTVPFYKVGDMNAAPTFMDDARVLFAKDEAKTFGITILSEGSVVFPKAGGAIATNKKRIIRTPGGIDLNCMSVTAKERILPRFLFYFFDRLDLTSLSTGSVLPQIGKKAVESTCLSLPPLAEQQRIVEILEEQFSRLDAALVSIRTVREKAKAFRQSLLQAAFSGELSVDGTAAWEIRKFSEVAHVDSNLTDPKAYGDLPHIAPNHIEAGTGRLLEYTTVKADGVTSGKHLFHPGHILYSKIRPYLNKVALVDFGGLCSADMYPISTSQNFKWLFYVMLSPEFVRLVSGTQNRTVLPKTNVRDLSAITIPVPPISVQHRIVEILEEQFSRLDAAFLIANQLEARIASERRSLLHAAFSGALTEQWRTTHNG